MGAIADVWHLHRERVLRICGVVLFVAAIAIVVTDGGGSERSAYDTGSVWGVATRNVVLSVVVATIGVYLVKRFYWYDESASWKEITPEATAIAGVMSVVLAFAIGAPTTEAERLNAKGPPTSSKEAVVADTVDCADEVSVAAGTLPPDAVELPQSRVLELNPQLQSVPPELRESVHMYAWQGDRGRYRFSTFPIPKAHAGDPGAAAEYLNEIANDVAESAPRLQYRLRLRDVVVAGLPAAEMRIEGTAYRIVAAVDGCQIDALEANDTRTADALEDLLRATSGRS